MTPRPELRCGCCTLLVWLALALFWPNTLQAADKLPSLGVDLKQTSVSGLSAGAYMAGQFEFAHADIVVGAGLVAGGPYGCAESRISSWLPGVGSAWANLSKAISVCMLGQMRSLGFPDANALARRARRRAANGDIAPLKAVAGHRIYLFTGTSDEIVVSSVVRAAAAFYRAVGVPSGNIKLVANIPAGHGFVSGRAKAACDRSGEPYVVNCPYDQAGDLLGHIYGALKPPSSRHEGPFVAFDQRPFDEKAGGAGLAASGIVYVPPSCSSAPGCRVHIAFHGCNQDLARVGRAFVTNSGLALRADTNRIVILFPQVATTAANRQACWDWWGYTGADFLTRRAPQIMAVRAMLARLAAARAEQ